MLAAAEGRTDLRGAEEAKTGAALASAGVAGPNDLREHRLLVIFQENQLVTSFSL